MTDKKPPLVDDYGYAGPWGAAKPGDVLPGVSKDPVQRQKDLEADEELERQSDIIGDQIARLSAQIHEARQRGDEAKVKELQEEQSRLTRLRLSL